MADLSEYWNKFPGDLKQLAKRSGLPYGMLEPWCMRGFRLVPDIHSNCLRDIMIAGVGEEQGDD